MYPRLIKSGSLKTFEVLGWSCNINTHKSLFCAIQSIVFLGLQSRHRRHDKLGVNVVFDLRWPMAGVSCVWGRVWRGGSVLIGGSGSADRWWLPPSPSSPPRSPGSGRTPAGLQQHRNKRIRSVYSPWFHSVCENNRIRSSVALEVKSENITLMMPWGCHQGYLCLGLESTDFEQKPSLQSGVWCLQNMGISQAGRVWLYPLALWEA